MHTLISRQKLSWETGNSGVKEVMLSIFIDGGEGDWCGVLRNDPPASATPAVGCGAMGEGKKKFDNSV